MPRVARLPNLAGETWWSLGERKFHSRCFVATPSSSWAHRVLLGYLRQTGSWRRARALVSGDMLEYLVVKCRGVLNSPSRSSGKVCAWSGGWTRVYLWAPPGEQARDCWERTGPKGPSCLFPRHACCMASRSPAWELRHKQGRYARGCPRSSVSDGVGSPSTSAGEARSRSESRGLGRSWTARRLPGRIAEGRVPRGSWQCRVAPSLAPLPCCHLPPRPRRGLSAVPGGTFFRNVRLLSHVPWTNMPVILFSAIYMLLVRFTQEPHYRPCSCAHYNNFGGR